jgi:hypothetical protein
MNVFSVIEAKRMCWMGHVPGVGELTNARKIVCGKREGRSLQRPKHGKTIL